MHRLYKNFLKNKQITSVQYVVVRTEDVSTNNDVRHVLLAEGAQYCGKGKVLAKMMD